MCDGLGARGLLWRNLCRCSTLLKKIRESTRRQDADGIRQVPVFRLPLHSLSTRPFVVSSHQLSAHWLVPSLTLPLLIFSPSTLSSFQLLLFFLILGRKTNTPNKLLITNHLTSRSEHAFKTVHAINGNVPTCTNACALFQPPSLSPLKAFAC